MLSKKYEELIDFLSINDNKAMVMLKDERSYTAQKKENGYSLNKGFVADDDKSFLSFCHENELRFSFVVEDIENENGNNISSLIFDLEEAKDFLSDYNQIRHLFSDDDGIRALANLNRDLGTIILKLKMTLIKDVTHPKNKAFKKTYESGRLVRIRPCGEQYGKKTYLGLLLGDISLSSSVEIDEEKIQCNWCFFNPAIFVFDLNDVIFGAESWWSVIEKEEDLRNITEETINNAWYVKALKQIEEIKKEEENYVNG